MKEEKRYIFTEEDINILSKPLPLLPCVSCYMSIGGGCFGCSEFDEYEDEYEKELQPFKDRRLLLIATGIQKYYSIKSEIDNLNNELSNVLNKLPDEIVDKVINKK